MQTRESGKAKIPKVELVKIRIDKDVPLLRRGSVVSQGLARVLRIVASDPRFIEALPNLMEESPMAYLQDPDFERLLVQTENDSVEVMFFGGGKYDISYGIVYKPKNHSSEKAAIDPVYDEIRSGAIEENGIDHNFIGIHVYPKVTGQEELYPFTLAQLKREIGIVPIAVPKTDRLTPVFKTIGAIMRDGTITLPKTRKLH